MSNPFSRLKHYRANELDPQENNATECLAACLSWSPAFRFEFLEFLLGEDGFSQLQSRPNEIEVETQVMVPNGFVDLVLRSPEFILLVEVKVNAKENGDHHRQQLLKYKAWLGDPSRTQRIKQLFTLVKTADQDFNPLAYDAIRKTWRNLFTTVRTRFENAHETDKALIESFCNYLESEGIVTTYNVSDLKYYSLGQKALHAVDAIFDRIDGLLREAGFECQKHIGKNDPWPYIEITHPRYSTLLSPAPRIRLWFIVEGIWEARQHDFETSIELWDDDDGKLWATSKPCLERFLNRLVNFKHGVWERWSHGNVNSPPLPAEAPKRVAAWKCNAVWGRDLTPSIDFQNSPDESTLINTLVARVIELASVVDQALAAPIQH